MPTTYPVPKNEEKRLEVLAEYRLMDTPPESDFDRLALLATRMTGLIEKGRGTRVPRPSHVEFSGRDQVLSRCQIVSSILPRNSS